MKLLLSVKGGKGEHTGTAAGIGSKPVSSSKFDYDSFVDQERKPSFQRETQAENQPSPATPSLDTETQVEAHISHQAIAPLPLSAPFGALDQRYPAASDQSVGETVDAEAEVGKPFFYMISTLFATIQSGNLKYSLEGLPRGTGLQLDASSGVLSGIPTARDAAAEQPLSLTLTASDESGRSLGKSWRLFVKPEAPSFGRGEPIHSALVPSSSFGVTQDAISSPVKPASATSFAAKAPQTQPSLDLPTAKPPAQIAYQGTAFFYKVQPPSDLEALTTNYGALARLRCSQTGLPAGTGLRLDPSSCVVSGLPNQADYLASSSPQGLQVVISFLVQSPKGMDTAEQALVIEVRPAEARDPSLVARLDIMEEQKEGKGQAHAELVTSQWSSKGSSPPTLSPRSQAKGQFEDVAAYREQVPESTPATIRGRRGPGHLPSLSPLDLPLLALLPFFKTCTHLPSTRRILTFRAAMG